MAGPVAGAKPTKSDEGKLEELTDLLLGLLKATRPPRVAADPRTHTYPVAALPALPAGEEPARAHTETETLNLLRGRHRGKVVPPLLAQPSRCVYVQVEMAGIPFKMLVDTGATTSCIGWDSYVAHRDALGPIEPPYSRVTGADGAPLRVKGRTRPITVRWGPAECQVALLVLGELEGVTGILGMDALRALHVLISAYDRTAHPQPARAGSVHSLTEGGGAEPPASVEFRAAAVQTESRPVPAPAEINAGLEALIPPDTESRAETLAAPERERSREECVGKNVRLGVEVTIPPRCARWVRVYLGNGAPRTTLFEPAATLPEHLLSVASLSTGPHCVVQRQF